ncbi:P-loop containing nucleoside triphosphate hydrolase protein [Xylariaceae sp. AK1471]|nr:P-loop containing nucleoside triphosphate hydrolase protein [Xylariaceae sp. AK1471]
MENNGRSNLSEQQLFRLLEGPTNSLKSRSQKNQAYSASHRQALPKLRELPASKQIGAVLKATQDNQCVVLTSGTGSGKTTVVPVAIVLDSLPSKKMVVCTQTRVLPAVTVAKHVAQQQDVELGQEVGYRVRFDQKVSKSTLLVFMTDGTLVRESDSDPLFSRYCCVVLDGVHERTINTDLLMARVKVAMSRRPDLKVVIMSATLNTSKFVEYFGGKEKVPHLHFKGNGFPVATYWPREAAISFKEMAYKWFQTIDMSNKTPPGDILIFMPGEEEIEWLAQEIRSRHQNVEVLSLYSSMPESQQRRIHDPRSTEKTRRVIVASPIVEASITIPGVVYVIDSGLEKVMGTNPRGRIDQLTLVPISKNSMEQRRGRCGRTQPGFYLPCFTKDLVENGMREMAVPAILREPVHDVYLKIKAAAMRDNDPAAGRISQFDWLDPPSPEQHMAALQELTALAYITPPSSKSGCVASIITPEGMVAARFPGPCKWYKAIKEGQDLGCAKDIAAIAACLGVKDNVLIAPRLWKQAAAEVHQYFGAMNSDHIQLLNVFYAFVQHKTRDGLNEKELKGWCHHHFLNFNSLDQALRLYSDYRSFLEGKTGWNKALTTFTNVRDVNACEQTIRKALARGLYKDIAMATKGEDNFKTVNVNCIGLLGPESNLVGCSGKWIVYDKFTKSAGKPYFVVCTLVEPEWLMDLPYFQQANLAKKRGTDELLQPDVAQALRLARYR